VNEKMENENPKGLSLDCLKGSQTDKKTQIIIIKTANDLNRLENYLNKGYVVQNHQFDSKRDYWLLSKPEIITHERPSIEAYRIVNVKGNENYVKETELLQKQGFKVDSVSTTAAIMIKYKEKEI
jgi:hypothetical protein